MRLANAAMSVSRSGRGVVRDESHRELPRRGFVFLVWHGPVGRKLRFAQRLFLPARESLGERAPPFLIAHLKIERPCSDDGLQQHGDVAAMRKHRVAGLAPQRCALLDPARQHARPFGRPSRSARRAARARLRRACDHASRLRASRPGNRPGVAAPAHGSAAGLDAEHVGLESPHHCARAVVHSGRTRCPRPPWRRSGHSAAGIA